MSKMRHSINGATTGISTKVITTLHVHAISIRESLQSLHSVTNI